jgi:hypothetical protein
MSRMGARAICQEMKNVRITFKIFEGSEQKTRIVAGGHVTEIPASITYSSVVSRDSIASLPLLWHSMA